MKRVKSYGEKGFFSNLKVFRVYIEFLKVLLCNNFIGSLCFCKKKNVSTVDDRFKKQRGGF
jgi:hypothetical protein